MLILCGVVTLLSLPFKKSTPLYEYDWGTKRYHYYNNSDKLANGLYDNEENCIMYFKNGKLNRLDGPAICYYDANAGYYINGNCITSDVKIWIKENEYPHYVMWDDNIKTHFALTFG